MSIAEFSIKVKKWKQCKYAPYNVQINKINPSKMSHIIQSDSLNTYYYYYYYYKFVGDFSACICAPCMKIAID